MDNLWDGLGAMIILNPDIKYLFGKVTMYLGIKLLSGLRGPMVDCSLQAFLRQARGSPQKLKACVLSSPYRCQLKCSRMERS